MFLQKNSQISNLIVVSLYFLLEYGYIKLLFNNNFINYFQYILLIVAIIMSFAKLAVTNKIYIDIVSILMIIFSIWVVFSKVYSISDIYSTLKISNFLVSLLFFFLVKILVEGKNDKKIVMKLIMCIASLNLFFIFIYFLWNFNYIIGSFSQGERLGSIDTSNPIWIARVCCETILCMFFLRKESKVKSLYSISIIFLLIITFITGSKGPIVALVISLLYYFYISNQHNFLKISLNYLKQITIASLTIIITLIFLNYFKYLDFIRYRFSLDSILIATEGYRLDRYLFTWEMIKEKYIIGYGLGSWPLLYYGEDKMDYPHNIFLELWVETGIIGLMIFLTILIYALKKISIKSKELQFIASLFLLSIAMAMFSGSLTEGNRGLYTYLGIISALYVQVPDYKIRKLVA